MKRKTAYRFARWANTNWKGCFSETEIRQAVDDYVSGDPHITQTIIELLKEDNSPDALQWLKVWEGCKTKRQLKANDTVICGNVKATIREITFQEPWEWRRSYYLEFTDTNGIYRSWKQQYDGGYAVDENGKEI